MNTHNSGGNSLSQANNCAKGRGFVTGKTLPTGLSPPVPASTENRS